MNKYKIKDLFKIEKGSLQSSKNVEGEFSFVTASSEWKTHNEYTHDCEALVFAMGASGSLGRTHHVKGKFISSDLCFILTPKEELRDKLNLHFYYYYFNFFRDVIVKETSTGTSKKAINLRNFSNYEIHYSEEQEKLVEKINIVLPTVTQLEEKNQRNLLLVKILRKKILEYAISGRISEQLDSDTPTVQQLQQMKEYKNKLIQEKKIKKTPKLAEITNEEKSFSLPEHWEWVRLGDISEKITDGTHQTPIYTKSGAMFLSAQNVKPFRFMPENHKYVSTDDYEAYTKNTKPELNDVLLTRVGSNIGESAVIDKELDFAIYVSLGLIKPLKEFVDSDYICLWLNSPDGTQKSLDNVLGRGTSQGNLNLTLIRNFLIPLPPIEEQRRISAKVKELMKFLDVLEEKVTKSIQESENIMKSILQESFRYEDAVQIDEISV